jgi:hypothetical protein
MCTGFWWKSQKGRFRHRWEINIEMDLKRYRMGCMDWTDVAQDRDHS